MERIIRGAELLEQINIQYGLSNEGLVRLRQRISEAKVCTPLVGAFSSGKSALVNALLRDSLLKEDITPETAVPAEVSYTEQEAAHPVTVLACDGTAKEYTIAEYSGLELNAEKTSSVRFRLHNEALAKFPDIELVDLPGFESGLELHNRAIDRYLPNSMAYLLSFPADDLILRSSVRDILRELCLHNMPVAAVITKADKAEFDDTYPERLEALKKSLTQVAGGRPFTWCKTSSEEGDTEELSVFLEQLQGKANDLFRKKFSDVLRREADNTRRYLETYLGKSSLSESALVEEERTLQREIDGTRQQLDSLSQQFERELESVVSRIQMDLQSALQRAEANLVTIAVNGGKPEEQINLIVRGTLAESLQNHYLPVARKYVKDAACSGIGARVDVPVTMESMAYSEKLLTGKSIAGVAMALVEMPLIGAALLLWSHLSEKQKREEAKQEAARKLREEVFPAVVQGAGERLKKELQEHAAGLRQELREQGSQKEAALTKALSDLRTRMEQEAQQKEADEARMRKDLQRLEELEHGI